MTRQDGDVSYNVSLKLDLNYDSVADGKEALIEALVYNYLLDIDETARYDNFEISRGQSITLLVFSRLALFLGGGLAISLNPTSYFELWMLCSQKISADPTPIMRPAKCSWSRIV